VTGVDVLFSRENCQTSPSCIGVNQLAPVGEVLLVEYARLHAVLLEEVPVSTRKEFMVNSELSFAYQKH
jgi:hypothetical protein